jgi:hypothetical protein
MKKTIIPILSLGVINGYAQTTKPIHFSIIQSVSTEGKESKNTDYYFSINMFSGTVKSIKGVEIGSLYNQNENDMEGFQASGLANLTKGNVMGYQTAGIANISGSVIGLQTSGISNHAKDLVGIQISGIANIANKVNGLQISGICNKAKTLKGLQIGLINQADNVEKGGGIGMINLYKTGGYREIEITFADYQNIGLSYKSGTKAFYSIVNIGYNIKPTSLLSSGFGIGNLRIIGKNLFFKPEIIWYNYVAEDFKFKNATSSSHLKLGFMKKMGKIGISLYPSVYYANIGKKPEGKFTEISQLKSISQNENGRWGFGLGLGLAFLK